MLLVKKLLNGQISTKAENEQILLERFKEKYTNDERFDENSELNDYLETLGLFVTRVSNYELVAKDLSKKYTGVNRRLRVLSRAKRLFGKPNLGRLDFRKDGWYLEAFDGETYRIPGIIAGKETNIEDYFETKNISRES